MYIGRDFAGFQNQSARILGFDLTNLLDTDETITAVTSRLRIADPALDPQPATHLPVAPQFSGDLVNQMVSFDDPADMLLGNIYALSFSATTSAGRVLLPWARFQIIPGYGITSYTGGSPPASAQSLVLPAPHLFYTIPTLLGGYCGVDYPTANQGETLVYGMDFSPALSPGETIISQASYLALFEGTDTAVLNDPQAYSSGVPIAAGAIVSQTLAWPGGSALSANVYVLQLTAVTSFSQSLAAKARITVGRVQ